MSFGTKMATFHAKITFSNHNRFSAKLLHKASKRFLMRIFSRRWLSGHVTQEVRQRQGRRVHAHELKEDQVQAQGVSQRPKEHFP